MTDSDRDKAAEPPAGAPAASDVAGRAGRAANAADAPPAAERGRRRAPTASKRPRPARAAARRRSTSKAQGRRRRRHWLDDLKAILWLVLAVLALPLLRRQALLHPVRIDDAGAARRATGWWSANIPMAGPGSRPSFHIFPHWQGRIWGAMPRRGDVVIVTPPGQSSDYIKRVIGLPGDTIEVIDGIVYLNGRALPREERPASDDPDRRQRALRRGRGGTTSGAGAGRARLLPDAGLPRISARRHAPYDTIDVGHSQRRRLSADVRCPTATSS